MAQLRRVYKLIQANRQTKTYTREGWKGPTVENGKVTLGTGVYSVDPNRCVFDQRRSHWPPYRMQTTLVQYYREGNPEPMDPMDFSKEVQVDAFERKKFADSVFIANLFRKEWDMTQALLILSILGNMVLGGVIYSILK